MMKSLIILFSLAFTTVAMAEANTVCMSFENGEKLGCDYNDSSKAEAYCIESFGQRYLPYKITKVCSLEKASSLRGEVSTSKLIDGDLRSSMDEVDSLLTMLDKNDVSGLFKVSRPVLKEEFYTSSMKAVMAKMNMAKALFLEKSHLNIIFLKDKNVEEFIKQTLRYLSFMGRLHKLYAYVAHQNHYVLKSYTFENLSYLNLVLKKDWALELLSKANFEVKTVDGGKNVEFSIGEQEKQTYEFMAMEEPNEVVDYAKLVTFLGVRENLTNLWAIDRLSVSNVGMSQVKSCGKDFLSFRAGATGTIASSEAMVDLNKYDIFYNDYIPRWNSLIDASRKVSILNGNEATFMYDVLVSVPEVKSFLLEQDFIQSTSDIKKIAGEDSHILISSENEAWNQFSNDHFSTILLPGDSVLNKNKIIDQISKEAFNFRAKAITDSFVGIYVWLNSKTIEKLEKNIALKLKDLEGKFKENLSRELTASLNGYGDKKRLASSNREGKIKETLLVAKDAAHAAHVYSKLDVKKPSLNGLTIMDPSNPEELMLIFNHAISTRYVDVKNALETNVDFAKAAEEFFSEVTRRFSKDALSSNGQSYKLDSRRRSELLRKISIEVAKEMKAKFAPKVEAYKMTQEYQITERALVRDNTNYVNPALQRGVVDFNYKNELNPSVQISRTPVKKEVNNRDYLTPVQASSTTYVAPKYNVNADPFKKESLVKKEVPQADRRNQDKVTTKEIAKPTTVTEKGEIKSAKGIVGFYNRELLELYKNAPVLSAKAKKSINAKGQREFKFDFSNITASQKIAKKEELLNRVFEALNLNVNLNQNSYFITDVEAQMVLVQNYLSQAYQVAPILRNEIKTTKTTKELVYNAKFDKNIEQDITRTFITPLLLKISSDAYSVKTGSFNEPVARNLVSKAFANAENEATNKLEKFCNANYFNYKNDKNFKDVFNASSFLRATLKDETGVSASQHKKISNFDAQISKEIRTKAEKLNEDFFEPALMVLGTVAIIAVGVVALIGSGGAAAPGMLGLAYASLSTFISIEFFASFPLVVGSLYSRVNTHFIEMPAQLKFQRSLAISQIDSAKVVDWDMLKASEKENKSSKLWTVGLMPLDFIYGGSLIRHVQKSSGLLAVKAYKRQTGMQLRKFSAPPKAMVIKRNFQDLKKKYGFFKAVSEKSKDIVSNIKMIQPKYTALPKEMIEGVPLRMGISKVAEEIGVAKRPWDLLEEMINYRSSLTSRIEIFSKYSKEEARMIQTVKLNGKLSLNEIKTFGLQYSKAGYIPMSLRNAYKNGKALNFFKNYGDVLEELNTLQAKLVETRAENIGLLVDKMMDFKRVKLAEGTASKNLMDEFLGLLTTEEIMAMEEMAKWSKGKLSSFKTVFTDYKTIISGLRPHTYLYGHIGAEFTHGGAYPANALMGEDVNPSYIFKNDKEDIVKFYESMMTQNGFSGEEFNTMRREIELELSRNYNAGR